MLQQFGVIPVSGLSSPDEAGPLAEALRVGGLPLIEVTLRTPTSLASLEAMARQRGILVGAGTVRTPAQLGAAVRAGASFVVSPCLTAGLAAAAAAFGVPLLPGVATSTEIQIAVDLGFSTVKFFPAESSGGAAAVAALAQPFHDVTFVPTGGITSATAPGYLALPSVAAIGGAWMLPASARQEGDWQSVAQSVSAACALARSRP
jgi:2-dehydro-3-deoxyphosphogluconate aldolase/(4S)-4-hydroxy-2-oxoglutarate aldolase